MMEELKEEILAQGHEMAMEEYLSHEPINNPEKRELTWKEKSARGLEIQRLLPRHFRILELVIEGWSLPQISSEVGMTTKALDVITKSPLFRSEVARRRTYVQKREDEIRSSILGDARDRLVQSAEQAALVQIGLLESKNESIKQRAATDILDRVFPDGRMPGVGQETGGKSGVQVVINAESINVLTSAINESLGRVLEQVKPVGDSFVENLKEQTPPVLEAGSVG